MSNGNRLTVSVRMFPALLAVFVVLSAAWCGGRDDWQQPQRVVEDLNVKAADAVADVGCGSGYFTFRLATAVGEKRTVFGVDIDRKALDKLQQRMEKRGIENIDLIHSEPTDTKLTAASLSATL